MNILQTINEYIEEHSGFEEIREYLGMSQLSKCSRALYWDYKLGVQATEASHRMSYAGYEQEANLLILLVGAKIAKHIKRELIAPFDNRLKGHIDTETKDGDLIELKSVSTEKFRKVLREDRPLLSHAVQVQMYMRYGEYERAFIVYRNRETYEHAVFTIKPDPIMQERYETKAINILRMIDKGIPPECECGRCK